MSGTKEHWDQTYQSHDEAQLSWFQDTPSLSLEWIERSAPSKNAPIVDVGGGASRLVDALIARGYCDLSVLDISEPALDRSRARLGSRAGPVSWIVADVTQWIPRRRWLIWHDRALFHFLTDEGQLRRYLGALQSATLAGATVIISAFALSGPERCSGLLVRRHSAESLADCLGKNFVPIGCSFETHVTPKGGRQDFLYAGFTRRV
jgi:hypothetical protein